MWRKFHSTTYVYCNLKLTNPTLYDSSRTTETIPTNEIKTEEIPQQGDNPNLPEMDVVTIYTMLSQGIVGYLTQQNPTGKGESRSDTPIKQQQQWWTTNEKPMALLVANALT